MQHAYATSPEALQLLAETQIVMGAARINSSALPENGTPVEMTIGTPSSLDTLSAPRQCEVHAAGIAPYMLELTPRADATIQTVISEAIQAAPSSAGPRPTAPKPGTGL